MPPRIEDHEDEEQEEYEEDEDGLVEDLIDENDDEDVEGDEEEEAEEEEEQAAPSTPWTGLKSLPEREDILQLLEELPASGRKQLTVLLLGKSSVGKSSLVNSLLGEALARVMAFKLQADTEICTPFSKHVEAPGSGADGLKVKLIDTCGLEDPEAGDTVNYAALKKIASDIKGQQIDVVLYVDRLDLYRVEPLDKAVMKAISSVLGRSVWNKTALVLTHGNLAQAPPGSDYDSYATRRVRALRRAVPAGRGPLFRPALPAVLVENSESCPADKAGKRMLPDSTLWVTELAATIVDVAMKGKPYVYRPSMTTKPNNSWKWVIPLIAAAQFYVWTKVLKPELDKDYKGLKAQDDYVWRAKAAERQRLGIGPPLRPSKENAWRLEQMYEDD
ncbi:hypothetical protein FOA52_012732 [Chlamydomonas sp. UWO 241]|nr:hypothetical protein FOA52_012732 [Chlamydomonas sp. UWO 241]